MLIRFAILTCTIAAMIAGCSSFNLSPECNETADGLRRNLAISDANEVPDFARLTRIISVTDMTEIASGYNRRTCSATVASNGLSSIATYEVVQSEGVKNFYEIEILNRDNQDLLELVGSIRDQYNAG